MGAWEEMTLVGGETEAEGSRGLMRGVSPKNTRKRED